MSEAQPKFQFSDLQPLVWFVVLLWIIKAGESLFHHSLHYLGVYPGDVTGLFGVLTSPLIHGDWEHLSNNTSSLLLLGSAMIYGYKQVLWKSVGVIWLLSGLGVWLFGRESYHFGASGVAYGLFYFLFAAALLRRDKPSIALMLIAVFMYGSMVLGVLPWDPKISFEGHMSGAVGGILSAMLFHKKVPLAPVKRYEWEHEDDLDDENPYWLAQHRLDIDQTEQDTIDTNDNLKNEDQQRLH